MGGCLGFCDDRGQRARAAVWGAGLTQALGRRGPWLRSLGPQSRTGGRGRAPGSLPEQDGRQRPGPGSLRLRLCENEHHSCRPGRAASGLLCEEGRGGRLGLEPGLRGGLPMQVDGAGWGVWESFKESSRPLRQQC